MKVKGKHRNSASSDASVAAPNSTLAAHAFQEKHWRLLLSIIDYSYKHK